MCKWKRLGNSRFMNKILFIFLLVVIYPTLEVGSYLPTFIGILIGVSIGFCLYIKGVYE